MKDMAFCRKTVVGPKPLDMDQGRLPQAIDRMLQGRKGDRLLQCIRTFPFALYGSKQLQNFDAFRKIAAVDFDGVVGE